MMVRRLPPELASIARDELNEDPKRVQGDLVKDWIRKQSHFKARTAKMPVRPLSPELAEKARKEFGEDPKTLEDSLRHLKEWIAKQPHLRARTDDQWLAAFLRGCKFSLERTKQKLDLYYSFRNLAPDFFKLKPTDDKFKEIVTSGTQMLLPKSKDPLAPRVVLIRPGIYDPSKYHILDVMAVENVKQRILLVEDDSLVINGAEFILDLQGVTMGHFSQMTPTNMKKMTVGGQDATPIRFKGGHYLNLPPGFETIYNFMKSLLNEKNRSRLHVHNKDYEALYKLVPKEILPTEYGGEAGSVAELKTDWLAKLEQYSSWLEEDLKYGTDESKRPGKPRTVEDMFGIEGSFRQLTVD